MDQAVIRRKLTGSPMVPDLCGGAEKAWPLALARTARDQFGLSVDCGRIVAERMSLTEVLELPPERAMIAVLEGPSEGLGVLMLSAEVLAGLIEAQTMGKVSAFAAPPRRPTRTDAALVAGFLDGALAGLENALQTDEDLIWTDGFRYASHLDEPRPLGLLLEDGPFKVLRVDCVLGGAKSGAIILALPADGHGRRPHRASKSQIEPVAATMVFSAALGEQVMASDCQLRAVVGRINLPLAALMRLEVGAVLALSQSALDRIELEGVDGRKLGVGRLGQHRGMRAVRLSAERSDRLVSTLAPTETALSAPKTSAAEATAPVPRLSGTG